MRDAHTLFEQHKIKAATRKSVSRVQKLISSHAVKHSLLIFLSSHSSNNSGERKNAIKTDVEPAVDVFQQLRSFALLHRRALAPTLPRNGTERAARRMMINIFDSKSHSMLCVGAMKTFNQNSREKSKLIAGKMMM